jgi:hypothetical protein
MNASRVTPLPISVRVREHTVHRATLVVELVVGTGGPDEMSLFGTVILDGPGEWSWDQCGHLDAPSVLFDAVDRAITEFVGNPPPAADTTFVRILPREAWAPRVGEKIEGIFTGFTKYENEPFEPMDAVALRCDDGSQWVVPRLNAVKLFTDAVIPISTRVRLTYCGSGPDLFLAYELEIAK